MTAFSDAAAKLAKPRPKLLDKRDVRAETATTDRKENDKVKARSKGQCEVWEYMLSISRSNVHGGTQEVLDGRMRRCPLRASNVHHLISGIGRRNRGASIESAHKLHVCERCHSEIHGHVLVPVDGTQREDAKTVRYERIR